MVDTLCGRTFTMKSENEEWTIFENLSENSVQHDSSSHRTPAPRAPKTKCLFTIGNLLDVTAKVGAFSRKLDQLMAAGFVLTPHSSTPHESCSLCSSPSHHATNCPTIGQCSDMSHEKVNVAFSKPGNDQYSNPYNLGWRNHTNFCCMLKHWEIQRHLMDYRTRHIRSLILYLPIHLLMNAKYCIFRPLNLDSLSS
jgi:hypothetical protein